MSKKDPKGPRVPKKNPHPMPGDNDEKSPAARIRENAAAEAEAKKAEAVKAAADAEELARLAEEQKVVKAELEKEAQEAIKTMPSFKIRDAVADRQRAMLAEIKKWSNKSVEDMVEGEPVGIWRSETAIRKLKLDSLPLGCELVHDIVPEPGTSINGVVFAPGSRQLLPQHMWDGIRDKCSRRVASEVNFYYPPRKPIQLGGKVFDATASPPPRWVR